MPKKIDDKIRRYKRKLEQLEDKKNRKRRRILQSSDSENVSDPELLIGPGVILDEEAPPNTEQLEAIPQPHDGDVPLEEHQEELDPEILCALGEITEDSPKFGEKIHESLARLWTPILRKGLSIEAREKLTKQFLIPENCPLLQAPTLNPEILAAISEPSRARDKRVESVQQQLGLGITAINRALVLLLDGDNKRLEAIKLLSDGCRILCNIHHVETLARKKFITPGLDKSFLTVVQEVDRDETLFGSILSEKIKASRIIEKQGLQIKKSITTPKPSASFIPQPSTSRPRTQGNWSGPPRYLPNRGGRGGQKRTASTGGSYHRAPPVKQSRSLKKTPRAP